MIQTPFCDFWTKVGLAWNAIKAVAVALVTVLFLCAVTAAPAIAWEKQTRTRWCEAQRVKHEDLMAALRERESKAKRALQMGQEALKAAERKKDQAAAQVAREAIRLSEQTLSKIGAMQAQENARVDALFESVSQALPRSLPQPDPVPSGLLKTQHEMTSEKRRELVAWRAELSHRIGSHNQRCRSLKRYDWAQLGQCHQVGSLLRQQTEAYAKALGYFKDDLRLAKEISGVPQRPASNLDPNTFTYFLWDRAENDRTMLDLQLSNMVSQTSSRPWPGPKNPRERLVNPLDEEQAQRDRDLLKPLNYAKIEGLSLEEVAQLVNARKHARIREATRNASETMHREMKRLEQDGLLKPGESVLEKEKQDPAFRLKMQGILTRITRQEIRDVHDARQKALEELGSVTQLREAESDPKRQRALFAAQERIIQDLESHLDQAHRQAAANMNREMARLKEKGYYKPGDDLAQKYRNDPRFRRAADEVLRKAVTHKVEAERKAQDRAFGEMLTAVKAFLRE